MFRIFLMLVFPAFVFAPAAMGLEPEKANISQNRQVAKSIAAAFMQAEKMRPEERLKLFQTIAAEVQEKCPANVIAIEQLQAASSAEELQLALRSTYDLLTFQMKKEAELPEGFPQPTPVGEIQIKNYPAYRLARTSSEKDSGFFTLFAHITLNRIAMTAPVEMNYKSDSEKHEPRQVDMAFLYGDKSLGKLGNKLGGVKVEDIPAMTTVCIGLKGDNDRRDLKKIAGRLEEWLEENAPEYELAGSPQSLRVMGYNSPQVPSDQRFFEVELPIKKK